MGDVSIKVGYTNRGTDYTDKNGVDWTLQSALIAEDSPSQSILNGIDNLNSAIQGGSYGLAQTTGMGGAVETFKGKLSVGIPLLKIGLAGYSKDGRTYGDNARIATDEAAGAVIGGEAGMEAGAAIGAGIGVWFFGVGAAPGAIIGGVVGAIIGGVWGGNVGKSVGANR